MIRLETLASILRRATALFLALPAMIFFGGWLRLPLALIVCAASGAAVWRIWQDASAPTARDDPPQAAVSWRVLLLAVILPSAGFTLLSGAGGWGAGDSDWLKHDALLRDLLTRPWPVTYESGHGPVLLVYYLAFYLPAALLGKLAGGSWTFASQMLAATMFFGTVLSALWLVVLGARGSRRAAAPIVAAALFFGFSGLDAFGKMLVNLFLRLPVSYGDWSDVSWWAQFAQYSANAATLFWAPQHAFAGWLPMAMALDDWKRHVRLEGRGVLYVALSAAWSPLAAVGLLPLVVGMIVWSRRQAENGRTPCTPLPPGGLLRRRLAVAREGWQSLLTVENTAGMLAGGMFALYLAAHFQPYPLPAEYRIAGGHHPMPLLEVLHVPFIALYAIFVALEFGALALVLAWFYRGAGRKGRGERALLALAAVVLLMLPMARYGYANDLVMRGGIPALFVLQVLLARMFADGTGRRCGALAAAGALWLGGLVNVGLEYRRHVVKIAAQGSWRDARTREPVRTLAELQRTVYARPGFDFVRQYLGAADSPFGRYAAARRGGLAPGTATGPADF